MYCALRAPFTFQQHQNFLCLLLDSEFFLYFSLASRLFLLLSLTFRCHFAPLISTIIMEPANRNARYDEISDQLRSCGLDVKERLRKLQEILPDLEERDAFRQYVLQRRQPHLANPSEPANRNARWDEISDQLHDRFLNIDERIKVLEEILPDPEERLAFCQYRLKKNQPPHLADPSGILTPARFVEIADSINFLNLAEHRELLPGLTWDFRPWIPLGYENTSFYRLTPSIYNLIPQKGEYPLTNHELLDPAFLGVNTTVQPREPSVPSNRRVLNLSEQSTQLAESDDTEAPGFVFHELGELQCWECETTDEMPTTLEEGDDCEGDWEETGFSVVARLSDSGHINGVYVIYNMKPRLELSYKREQITHDSWGIPPSSPGEQFSCARIGNKMGDFGFKNKLAWKDQVQHPVELVWAVKSSTGGAMRITVDSNYQMHSTCSLI